jgi:hypothetical protein
VQNQNYTRFSALITAVALTLAIVQPASAYVEPGSGALLWQMMVAGLVGGLFYFRRATRWFTSRLTGRDAGSADDKQ